MGKTSLALNIAVNATKQSSRPTAIFTLEMLQDELALRLMSAEAKIDSRCLRTKKYDVNKLKALSDAVPVLSGLPLYINDSAVSLKDILVLCKHKKEVGGLGLVIVDYLQLIVGEAGSRELQVSEITRGLKATAKELDCPVIVISQLNRSLEARPNKRPSLSDFRESGSIEQDADVVLFVYRDEVYNPDSKELGIAEVIIGKNRSGDIGTVKLAWIGEYTSFLNLNSV